MQGALIFSEMILQCLLLFIVFDLLEYVQQVDWAGRQIWGDKRDAIDSDTAPIINRPDSAPEH